MESLISDLTTMIESYTATSRDLLLLAILFSSNKVLSLYTYMYAYVYVYLYVHNLCAISVRKSQPNISSAC